MTEIKTGCHTYAEGWHNCNACVYRDNPLGCDGFTADAGAKVEYDTEV